MSRIKSLASALVLAGAAILAGGIMGGPAALAQEVTLRFHTFVPAVSSSYKNYAAWTKTVEEKSGGKIKFEMYPSMQLGGKPADLYTQAKNGVVDVIYTLAGYTPGVFPRTEVWELPFIGSDSLTTSQAMEEFYPKHLTDEYKDVHLLIMHAPDPPVFHVRGKPIRTLEDLKGRKLRTPSKTQGQMLEIFGAVPVGIAGANITEAMLRGVVEGMTFPWGIARANKVIDAADSHTIAQTNTSVLITVMNKRKYDGLSADLKKVLAEATGMPLARQFGVQWAKDDEPAIAHAKKLGHEIYVLPKDERARWAKQSEPVITEWVEAMEKAGHPGQQLVDDARALIAKYEK